MQPQPNYGNQPSWSIVDYRRMKQQLERCEKRLEEAIFDLSQVESERMQLRHKIEIQQLEKESLIRQNTFLIDIQNRLAQMIQLLKETQS